VKKTLIVVGSVLGGLLVLCCAGGVALYLLADTTYGKPSDPCAISALDSLSDLGDVSDKKPDTVNAFGRTYSKCVVTLGADRSLTVVVDVPSSGSDARAHYDTVRKIAGTGTVADLPNVGTKAFTMYTLTGDSLMFELDFYDGNLYASLNFVADGVTAEQARAWLTTVAKGVMSSLEQRSSGSDWDD
jgi:hypothetical protein